MMKKILIVCCLMLFILPHTHGNSRQKKALYYPKASLYGMFLALALPIELPDKNVFISYNFEANYHVPENASEYGNFFAPITEVVRRSRSIDRRLVYQILEDKFEKNEVGGRSCLLRSICEAADAPFYHHGFLGGVLHVILTPSSSKDENLPIDFYLAEEKGLSGDCDSYKEVCPAGLLDFISWIEK